MPTEYPTADGILREQPYSISTLPEMSPIANRYSCNRGYVGVPLPQGAWALEYDEEFCWEFPHARSFSTRVVYIQPTSSLLGSARPRFTTVTFVRLWWKHHMDIFQA